VSVGCDHDTAAFAVATLRRWWEQAGRAVYPDADRLLVTADGVSALAGTELDRLFRLKDVNTLVLTGVATQFAVEGTAREAVDRGYRVLVLEDCCASRLQEVHRFSIDSSCIACAR
jgi:nicotinamidase-related amidase